MPEVVLARYRNPTRPWYNKEYRFRLLGDLKGKRILDVGCGMGENAILLAARGAHVTGVDISPRSIEAAKRLAARTSVEGTAEFLCGPLETIDFPAASFDVIWGDGVLHHVLHDLDRILRRLVLFAREGATFLISEPVDRVPGMRRIRLLLPIEVDGTPDERPLVEAELRLIRRYVPGLRIKAFSFLSRVNRFILPGGSLERASKPRRALSEAVTRIDYALLSAPVLCRLGGIVVLAGRVQHGSCRRLTRPNGLINGA